MPKQETKVLIIGNGVAGFETALEIRRRNPDWEIYILSEESEHFFSRTALIYSLSGQLREEEMEPYERDAYRTYKFERISGRALSLNTAEKTVLINEKSGTQIFFSYDKLVLACGSKPRKSNWPGEELLGVGNFVTLQDLRWLETELFGDQKNLSNISTVNLEKKSKNPKNTSAYELRRSAFSVRGHRAKQPSVVGGGLIGIEVIETLISLGYQPHFFIREKWFWPIVLDEREAKWIAKQLESHGVQVHVEENVESLIGHANGCVERIETDKGSYESDLVVSAIGVVPNTDWLADTCIELDSKTGGVLVDEQQQTSAKHVYAVGDCAAVHWFDGRVRPEQLWYTARDQGKVCGKVISGENTRYERGTWYNSAKLMDIEYTTVGYVGAGLKNIEDWYFEETGKVKSTTRILHRNSQVMGFNFLGRRWNHEILVEWIEQKKSLDWVLANLPHASFDTEFVPPLEIHSNQKTNA